MKIQMNAAESLEARFRRLEKDGRAIQAAFAATAVLVGVLLLAGAGPPPQTFPELRTRRLAVVDSEGRERAVIDVASSEPPRQEAARIQFFDANGAVLLVAGEGLYERASAFKMRDASGNDRITIVAGGGESHARTYLYDARARERVHIYSQPQSLSGIQAVGSNGKREELSGNFDIPPPRRRK